MVDAPPKEKPRLFLVDAYALIYRAFYAFINRPLVSSRGENTSAPFGFVNFLLRIREEYDPDYLAIVFDAGTSQREEIYPEYKATREKMPDELRDSLPRIRQLVDAFHDPVIELEGFEADDVIGTLARKARDQGLEAVIVSGDKDFYQLVGPGIHLLNPGRGGPTGVEAEWVDETNAPEKFGVPPERVVDLLALMGDSSDNVPGAPGIGETWARRLLTEIGDLDELLEEPERVPWDAKREALRENASQVRLSKELVRIRTDLDVELDLDRLKVREPDRRKLRDLFIDLEFRTLLEKHAAPERELEGAGEEGEVRYRLVTDPAEVAEVVGRLREAGEVSVDTETTSLDPVRAKLVGISLSYRPGEAFYLPFGHLPPGELDLDGVGESEVANLPSPTSAAIAPLRKLLEDPGVRKVGQNLKYDLTVLRRAGVELRGVWFDTMVASYVLDPGRRQHSLDVLATDFLAYTTASYDEVTGRGKGRVSFARVPLDEATTYACEDADIALRLKEEFQPDLEEQELDELFHELEMPLVPVLARMEEHGIRIDVDFFRKMSEKLAAQLAEIEAEVHELAGEEFNLNSPIQLREILFDRLEMPVVKRTKTGPSTDASVLEELASRGYELPERLLDYRQLEKLRSTYVDALPELVNPETGRIHTSFNQTVTATGRLSSSDPNLQNIPIRTELGREIRKGFVPDEGCVFLGADYSQIELRILAHFSGDEAFVRAFREGIDVHRQTAAVIFDVEIDEVSPEMRARAKTINFATLYGQGAASLGRQLGIDREEAQTFIDQYFERFSGVRGFLDEQVETARDRGWVETLLGRRRYVPELKSQNWSVRQFGERVAQNTPIQGTAADLIKRAMIEIDAELGTGGRSARMLLQVHDELVFEVSDDDVEGLRELVVEKMEGAVELDVPLVVDVGVGESWYHCKA